MKRVISIVAVSLVCMSVSPCIVSACTPPTTHAILRVGGNYDFALSAPEWSVDGFGVNGAFGVETPMRFIGVMAEGGLDRIRTDKRWYVGGLVEVNPLGLGIDSPVNPIIGIGGGYVGTGTYYAKASLAIELGSPSGICALGFREELRYVGGLGVRNELGVYLKFRIGKDSW